MEGTSSRDLHPLKSSAFARRTFSPTIMTFCAGPDILASKNIDQNCLENTCSNTYEVEGLPNSPEAESSMSHQLPILEYAVNCPPNRWNKVE